MGKKAVVLLAEGFEEIEAAAPIDVLRRADVEVTVAGVGGTQIKGCRNLRYIADVEISALQGDFDLLVIPGGLPGAANIGNSPEAKNLAQKMFSEGKLVAALCAAPVYTFGPWGILDGKTATCHPGQVEKFPKTAKHSGERVVVDGTVITSQGPGTAIEFSLALVAQLFDSALADRIATAMVVKK